MDASKTGYERFTATTGEELTDRLRLAESRFVDLVRSVPDGVRSAGSDWTAREVTGHVLTVVRRYTRRDTTRTEGLGSSPREVDRINREELAALGGISKDRLVEELAGEMDLLRDMHLERLPLDTEFPFHGGVRIDAAAGLSNLVGEFLLHGMDVARAIGREWPIDQRDAVLILNGVLQIIPAYADPTATAGLSLAVQVQGARSWLLDFRSGHLSSRLLQPDDRPDVKIRTPADALMLSLYSRLTPLGAVRRGAMIVGGRRPWRLLRLNRLIQQP